MEWHDEMQRFEETGELDPMDECKCPDCSPKPEIVRKDKYTIQIDETNVRATLDQETRIRQLTPEQLANFKTIMGG
jgi:hypothetical protein